MGRKAWSVGLLLFVPGVASAAVSIVAAPRSELLYSGTKDVDCTKLHETTDLSKLPFNIARLQALVNGVPADPSIRLQWSLKGDAVGELAADLDLGPTGSAPVVTAMCADFGNQCLLSGDRLKTYDEATIFYVAPTCDDLMRNPSKPFKGGQVTIQVKAFQGRKKLGKAKTKIGFGNNGATTLFVSRVPDGEFVDGVGKSVVSTFLNPIYAATLVQPNGVPNPPVRYQVAGALGSVGLISPCEGQFVACNQFTQSPGKGIMTLTTTFEDDSALCDNINVVVANCNGDSKLEVIPSPKRSEYDPAKSSQSNVNLIVRFRNTSKPANGLPACDFSLQGSDILTCTSTVKVGTFTDTKSTSFSLPHCAQTTNQTCTSDAGCMKPACPACENPERCLTEPYCSVSTDRPCTTDADCTPPICPNCGSTEICVHQLDFPSGNIGLGPGQFVDLINGTVVLRNHFKTTAKLVDTWTVNVDVPPFSVSKTLKYRIRGRP